MHAAGDDGAVGGRALTGAAPAGACVAHRLRDAGCRSTQPNTHAHASSPRRATQDQAKGCAGLPQAVVRQRQVMAGQRRPVCRRGRLLSDAQQPARCERPLRIVKPPAIVMGRSAVPDPLPTLAFAGSNGHSNGYQFAEMAEHSRIAIMVRAPVMHLRDFWILPYAIECYPPGRAKGSSAPIPRHRPHGLAGADRSLWSGWHRR